jgi:type VI secretion system protein ImpK
MTSAPNLASAYQEILTVVARLRSKKVALGDSAVFRTQVRKALQQAESSAQALGYSQEDQRLASYATIALLDETILNSSNPAFRDWAQKPLMLDLYETLTAGETFFEQMRAIAKRGESKSTIDLLEVYALCLALGFRGRYSSGSEDQLRVFRDPLIERILRSRGTRDRVELSSSWMPEENVEMPAPANRLTRLALSGCVAIFSVCLLLWIGYHFFLGRGADAVAGIMPR